MIEVIFLSINHIIIQDVNCD